MYLFSVNRMTKLQVTLTGLMAAFHKLSIHRTNLTVNAKKGIENAMKTIQKWHQGHISGHMANNLKESGESEMSKTSRRQKRPITIADFRNIEGSSVATSPTSINDLLPLNVPSQVKQTDQGNCLEDQPTGMSDSIGSVNIGHKRGHIVTEADQGATCNTLPNPGFVETGGYSGPTTKDLTSPITRSASYQTCPNHKHTDSLIDHFCKDHLCLVCAKCAGRNNSHCKTDAIANVCLDINVMDELKRFKRSILNFKNVII